MTTNEFPVLTLREAADRLKTAGRVLICIHQHPDGDAVGSGFALAEMLRGMGKSARVVCGDEIPHRLRFLMREQMDAAYTEGMEEDYDLLCAVDTASVAQLGALAPLAEKITLSIDHHEKNTPFCPHCTRGDASAAGEVLFDLASAGEFPLTADVSRLLYAAVVSDTGSFRFANTTKETMQKAAVLLGNVSAATDGGDDLAMINHRLFQCCTMSELRAQRAGIDALRLTRGGRLGIVVFTAEMLRENDLTSEDIGNIVDLPRAVDGVQIALSVKQSETDPTGWRVSSRASVDVDVSAVCAVFGGGGHRRAAGCTVTAPDAETAFAIVERAFGDALEGIHG